MEEYTIETSTFSPVPAWIRFHIYGLQGLCDEVVFSAFLSLFSDGKNIKLKGESSLYSFFIFAGYSILQERLYLLLKKRYRFSAPLRLCVYLPVLYCWEYCTGWILQQFDACPWDYRRYTYNVHGLITLEYAPGWLILCGLLDILADYLLSLGRMKRQKAA